jgi:hypothetical protein
MALIVPVTVASGGDKNFLFTQISAATTWSINHNLGKYPSIEAMDSTKRIIQGDIQHIDLNNSQITFNSAVSGGATCN